VSFVDLCISRSPVEAYIVTLDVAGKIFTWGTNTFGQLGHGDLESKALPQQVHQLRRKKVS
jgi:alpha-tubulin suppressor-like RCC1 family protein